ncbi:MAG: UDP-N-acetylmuramate dehydrogenase [Gemmataceae bacterium]|nr:UDP-N-acetylmuramate dehydrogenase [Gemmataceae bacterium]
MISGPLMRALSTMCDGPVQTAVPSVGLVTLRAGGPIATVVEPHSLGAAHALWAFCHREGVPVVALGKGSNALVVDAGFPGVVFRLSGALTQVNSSGRTMDAGAGATQPAVARCAGAQCLSGAEFLIGIPGTMGGAVCMNAGCHGAEIEGIIEEVRSVTARGEVRVRKGSECGFGIRRSVFQQEPELILGVRLKLTHGDGNQIRARLRHHLTERKAKQPLRYPNCGSVFKNPCAGPAWKFIADAGLRGQFCGRAQVSEKHTNFIVNRGRATAADILGLMKTVQEKVRLNSGVTLAPELVVFG